MVAVEKDRFFIETEVQIDAAALKIELLKDLDYRENFLDLGYKNLATSVLCKMRNLKLVEVERRKQADAEARIGTIEKKPRTFVLRPYFITNSDLQMTF